MIIYFGNKSGDNPLCSEGAMMRAWVVLFGCLWGWNVATALSVRDIEVYGGRMSLEAANALEASLKQSPHDETARIQLYGYYTSKLREPGAVEARMGHALWLIEHSPRSAVHRSLYVAVDRKRHPEAFERARDLWLGHIDRYENDLAILEYGGIALSRNDSDMAEKLFHRGAEAEPEEPRWYRHLAHLKLRAMNKASENSETQQELAAVAFGFFEDAYQFTSDWGRGSLLLSLCQTAIRSKQYEVAERYAERMLLQGGANQYGYQKNHYHGHAVLGVLRFESGDLVAAKRLLMRSIALPESARNMTSEPDFSLVRRFIEKGEFETAMTFFNRCEPVWKSGQTQLREWQAQLKRGESLVFEHPPMY